MCYKDRQSGRQPGVSCRAACAGCTAVSLAERGLVVPQGNVSETTETKPVPETKMTPTLMLVNYDLNGPVHAFRTRALEAAAAIAQADGLIWKIWGLEDSGAGSSAYLFRDSESAKAFAAGPALKGLREKSARNVSVRMAPVNLELSSLTHALGETGSA